MPDQPWLNDPVADDQPWRNDPVAATGAARYKPRSERGPAPRPAPPRGERGKPSLYLDRPATRSNVDTPPQLNRGALPAVRSSRPARGPNSRPQPDDKGQRATRDRPGLAPRLPTVQGPLSPMQQAASSLASFEGAFRQGLGGLADMSIAGVAPDLQRLIGASPVMDAVTDPANEYIPLNATDRVAAGLGRNIPNAAMPGGLGVRALSVAGPAVAGEGFRSLADMAGADETGQAIAEFGGNIVGSLPSAVVSAPSAAKALITRQKGPPRVVTVDTPTGGFRVVRPQPPRKPPATLAERDLRTLDDAGIITSAGQRSGRGSFGKITEDIFARAPILGPAVRGQRAAGGESFNRALVNRPLAAIGETIPDDVWTGTDAVAYVSRRLGQGFEDAYASIPDLQAGPELASRMAAKIEPVLPVLSPDNQGVLQGILGQRLNQLRSGAVSGRDLGRIRSEINGEATDYLSSGDPNQRNIGRALSGVVDELDVFMARSDPTGQVGQRLKKLREGWAAYAVVRRASAGASTGEITPAGLAAAVKGEDRSVSRGAAARGEARMQDLSGAAARVMPDSFGAPGTADALGVQGLGAAWIGGAAAAGMGNPIPLAAAATGTAALSVAAIPYWLAARNVTARVGRGASEAQLQAAAQELAQLAQQAPPDAAGQILAMRESLLRVGAAGAIALSASGSASADQSQPPR